MTDPSNRKGKVGNSSSGQDVSIIRIGLMIPRKVHGSLVPGIVCPFGLRVIIERVYGVSVEMQSALYRWDWWR